MWKTWEELDEWDKMMIRHQDYIWVQKYDRKTKKNYYYIYD